MKIVVVTRRGGIDFKNFVQIKFADQGGEVGKKEGVVCLSGGGGGEGGWYPNAHYDYNYY